MKNLQNPLQGRIHFYVPRAKGEGLPLAQLENIRLYYEEHGQGPPLILVHGHACGVRSWDPQLRGRSCLMTNRAHGIALSTRGVQARRPSIYALEPQLRGLHVPVLLIVGEYDESCVPVHAFMGRNIPNAAQHVLPGAGHLTNLEAPEAFNSLVVEFLDENVAKVSAM